MAPSPATHRLVVVTQEFYPFRGGIAVYATEMAKAAAAAGYAVEVWAHELPPGLQEPAWLFAVRRLPVSNSHSWLNQWRLAWILWRERHYLKECRLYVVEPGPWLALTLLQFLHALPSSRIYLTLHGSEILRFALRPLLRLQTQRLLARTERISVVSQHTRHLLEECFPSAAGKAVLTPGALRSDFAVEDQAAPPPSSTNGKIIVLTVARLHPRKGQLCVLEALASLPHELRGRVEYWLAGTHGKSAYESALHAAATTAGFPVKFLGNVPDAELPALYAQADIFAMTSMPHELSVEGFGLVYLEAGARGLPVIAHAIGGVPEAVRHHQTGLLVEPDDREGLTAAFACLIHDEAFRRQLGDAGRLHARSHSWERNVATLFGQPPGRPPA